MTEPALAILVVVAAIATLIVLASFWWRRTSVQGNPPATTPPNLRSQEYGRARATPSTSDEMRAERLRAVLRDNFDWRAVRDLIFDAPSLAVIEGFVRQRYGERDPSTLTPENLPDLIAVVRPLSLQHPGNSGLQALLRTLEEMAAEEDASPGAETAQS